MDVIIGAIILAMLVNYIRCSAKYGVSPKVRRQQVAAQRAAEAARQEMAPTTRGRHAA